MRSLWWVALAGPLLACACSSNGGSGDAGNVCAQAIAHEAACDGQSGSEVVPDDQCTGATQCLMGCELAASCAAITQGQAADPAGYQALLTCTQQCAPTDSGSGGSSGSGSSSGVTSSSGSGSGGSGSGSSSGSSSGSGSGGGSSGGGVYCSTGGDPDFCYCTTVSGSQSGGTACSTGLLQDPGACCADPGWPSSGTCTCSSFLCEVNQGGGYDCFFNGKSGILGTPATSATGAACCLRGDGICSCYDDLNKGSCDGFTNVSSCTISALAPCTGVVSQGQMQVPSCQ